MALDETIGMCDLCGKEADANLEVRPTCSPFCSAARPNFVLQDLGSLVQCPTEPYVVTLCRRVTPYSVQPTVTGSTEICTMQTV